jgi:sugar lactone lactonase YvrE
VVAATGDVLGEGPVWDPRGALWWVDIRRRLIHRLADGDLHDWVIPSPAGSIAPADSGGLIAAVRSGFSLFDPESGHLFPLAEPEPERTGNRFNDGGCDPEGRFWAGTMDDAEVARTGAVYRLDGDHSCKRVFDGLGIPNTFVWSADGSTMFVAESTERVIYAHEYDTGTGIPGRRRVFAETEGPGYPDGSAIDVDGCLWNAQIDGGRLVRYTPKGRIDQTVELPVQRPTSCEFGGDGLGILYVTTATVGLTAQQLEQQPLAGALLALDLGVTGLPVPSYRG